MGLNYFYFNGKSSAEFGVFISGEHTWATPREDMDIIAVPGKNGTVSISRGRYENIDITYPCFIADDFDKNFSAFKAYLMSQSGRCKLYDTYHSDVYRIARYLGGIFPQMTQLNRHGEFEITFDCDPRRFLTNTSTLVEHTTGVGIKNDTRFTAKPLIRAYGTGTVTIGSISVTVNTASGYTDLDCEIQEAYKDSTNCNGNITLTNGEFPVIEPGINAFTYTGFSKVEIALNLWTI